MERLNKMKKLFTLVMFLAFFQMNAQDFPNPAMVGYWEGWSFNSNFVALKDVDDKYNVICIAFAQYNNNKDYDLKYVPPSDYTEEEFKNDIVYLQSLGKKVLISIGGQTTPHILDSLYEKEIFVSSVNAMVDYWGFDGVDIDLEGGSVHYSDINVQDPGDTTQKLFIQGLSEILDNHQSNHGERLLLTMAPETAYVQGALSPWGGAGYKGAYLPIIEAFRDDIDMLNVQLYNSGSMYGVDGVSGGEFGQGNADFVLAMTEAVILGFTGEYNIGTYSGLPAHKVGVALPGCHSTDAVPHAELEATMKYLRGEGPQPGNYTLKTEGGYPDIRGMMTWSINSDKFCDPSYGFVTTYDKVFGDAPYIKISNTEKIYEGEEDGGQIKVELFRSYFEDTLKVSNWNIGNLPEGVSLDSVVRTNDSVAHLVLKGNALDIDASYPWAISDVSVTVYKQELVSKLADSSFSNIGVILSKYPRAIPGVVEGESYENYFGTKRNTNYGVYWQGDWSEYPIDVQESGDYILDFKLRTGTGNRKIRISVDGVFEKDFSYASNTSWEVFENYQTQIQLTEGVHTLKIHSTLKWFHLDNMTIEKGVLNSLDVHSVKVKLFPNPATSSITITGVDSDAEIMIFNTLGVVVKKEKLVDNKIDVGNLSSGAYTIKVEEVISKFIKN